VLIAKVLTRGDPHFFEVLKSGTVVFDDRPGWILLGLNPGSRKQDMKWIHPDDTEIEWVREFNFGE
jgi:hypothetical protein